MHAFPYTVFTLTNFHLNSKEMQKTKKGSNKAQIEKGYPANKLLALYINFT